MQLVVLGSVSKFKVKGEIIVILEINHFSIIRNPNKLLYLLIDTKIFIFVELLLLSIGSKYLNYLCLFHIGTLISFFNTSVPLRIFVNMISIQRHLHILQIFSNFWYPAQFLTWHLKIKGIRTEIHFTDIYIYTFIVFVVYE